MQRKFLQTYEWKTSDGEYTADLFWNGKVYSLEIFAEYSGGRSDCILRKFNSDIAAINFIDSLKSGKEKL